MIAGCLRSQGQNRFNFLLEFDLLYRLDAVLKRSEADRFTRSFERRVAGQHNNFN